MARLLYMAVFPRGCLAPCAAIDVVYSACWCRPILGSICWASNAISFVPGVVLQPPACVITVKWLDECSCSALLTCIRQRRFCGGDRLPSRSEGQCRASTSTKPSCHEGSLGRSWLPNGIFCLLLACTDHRELLCRSALRPSLLAWVRFPLMPLRSAGLNPRVQAH